MATAPVFPSGRLCLFPPSQCSGPDQWHRLALAVVGNAETTEFGTGDVRAIMPRFTPEARTANQAVVDLLGRIADGKDATPAQIALAWLLAQKPWIAPKARRPAHGHQVMQTSWPARPRNWPVQPGVTRRVS